MQFSSTEDQSVHFKAFISLKAPCIIHRAARYLIPVGRIQVAFFKISRSCCDLKTDRILHVRAKSYQNNNITLSTPQKTMKNDARKDVFGFIVCYKTKGNEIGWACGAYG